MVVNLAREGRGERFGDLLDGHAGRGEAVDPEAHLSICTCDTTMA